MNRERKRAEKSYRHRAGRRAEDRRRMGLVVEGGLPNPASRKDGPTDLDTVEYWINSTASQERHHRRTLEFYGEVEAGGRIIYEDGYLLAIDKASGVNSYRSEQSPVGVLEVARSLRPHEDMYLVQGQPRETTGIVLLGKGVEPARILRAQLTGRGNVTAEKKYVAFVDGEVVGPDFEVCVGIAQTRTQRMAVISRETTHPDALPETEKPSRTILSPGPVLTLEADGSQVTLIQAELRTDRMHQLRAVAADYLHHPIVGDHYYGAAVNPFANRTMIHAYSLRISHPADGSEGTLVAPIPDAFKKFVLAYNADPAIIFSGIKQPQP